MGFILSGHSKFSFLAVSICLKVRTGSHEFRIRSLLEVEVRSGVIFSRWLDLDPLDLSPDPRLWLIELESYDLQKEVLNPVLQIL